MKVPDIIPWYWKAGAAIVLVAALFGAGAACHHDGYQQGHDDATAERAAQDGVRLVTRLQSNAGLSIKQGAFNVAITKAKNEELASVAARIAAERVRVGPALCSGPAAAPDTQSAAGSDSTNPPGRLVRPDIDRDIVALKLAVETDLATGRACQAFLDKNGLEP